jgi:hypothetical protein
LLAGLFGTTPTATTLAILRSSNELVIAADSLMTLYDGRPQQACKIRMHGDVVFATAGLVVSSEGVLDTHRVITDVLRRPVTWTEHVQTIEDRLQEPLLRTLRRLRRERPDEFRRRIQQGFVLHVTLAAVRYGRTVLEMREFFVETNGPDELRIRVKRVSCPGQCLREIEVFGVGETEAMMRELREIRRFPPDLAAFGRDLVMRQIRATPVFVGPPVDVIRIAADGVHWVNRKPSCLDYCTAARPWSAPGSTRCDGQEIPESRAGVSFDSALQPAYSAINSRSGRAGQTASAGRGSGRSCSPL